MRIRVSKLPNQTEEIISNQPKKTQKHYNSLKYEQHSTLNTTSYKQSSITITKEVELSLKNFKAQPEPYQASSLISIFGRENNLNAAFDIYKTLINSSKSPHIGI